MSSDAEGVATPDWPLLPWARGPLSASVISALQRSPGTLGATPPVSGIDALGDDDFALALYLCYEVHYRAVTDTGWEWDTDLLKFRAELERAFENRLRDDVVVRSPFSSDVVSALDELIHAPSGPSLSAYLLESGTLEQLREFCVHRSAYQLKEADPHTFGIPRLTGEAKAAMVEIQFEEYGSGDAAQMHSHLFANTMNALGLDPACGRYVEVLPGTTLATVNLVSMFALHQRWRAALVGHLAVFEMTSIEPMGRYSKALARFGIGSEGRRFYDVHVLADERHGLIARDRMVAGLMRSEPELGSDVLFGAAAILMLEQRFATHLLNAWADNRSSLISQHPNAR
ncbi:MAG TPA: iron-containing redox enzyme family protein [Acidimicrobiales bacterium]